MLKNVYKRERLADLTIACIIIPLYEVKILSSSRVRLDSSDEERQLRMEESYSGALCACSVLLTASYERIVLWGLVCPPN